MAKTLREIMTKEVRTIAPTASIFEAARLMKEIDVGLIPVVQEGTLMGVLSDRDIVLRVVAESRDPLTSYVQDAISSKPITASPGMDVKQAADLMGKEQIRRLPICENGKLVGIVSLGDLALEGTRDSTTGQTLSEISVPAQPKK